MGLRLTMSSQATSSAQEREMTDVSLPADNIPGAEPALPAPGGREGSALGHADDALLVFDATPPRRVRPGFIWMYTAAAPACCSWRPSWSPSP
jgi:hypothetical protein